jgi:MarR family transcriptional regulator, organic hydroperoxide resistance regulator
MTLDQAVRVVQSSYPQVYLACHTRHQRKRSTEHRLSPRDSSILAHLHPTRPIAPSELARHLSIGRPTMSEALKRLVALGFANRGGTAAVTLSDKGARAVRETSVLEHERVASALASLTARDRRLVCRGLETLARACRELYQ